MFFGGTIDAVWAEVAVADNPECTVEINTSAGTWNGTLPIETRLAYGTGNSSRDKTFGIPEKEFWGEHLLWSKTVRIVEREIRIFGWEPEHLVFAIKCWQAIDTGSLCGDMERKFTHEPLREFMCGNNKRMASQGRDRG
jgi:hypothetical protein